MTGLELWVVKVKIAKQQWPAVLCHSSAPVAHLQLPRLQRSQLEMSPNMLIMGPKDALPLHHRHHRCNDSELYSPYYFFNP